MDTVALPEGLPAQRFAVLRIIWLALMAAVPVYGLAGALVAGRGGGALPAAQAPAVGLGLGMAALAMVWASVWCRQRFLDPDALAAGATDPLAVLGRFQRASIAGWALAEGVTVLGLVATLLTGQVVWVMLAVLVTLLLMGTVLRPAADRLAIALRAARRRSA